jgi:hypothetical protein
LLDFQNKYFFIFSNFKGVFFVFLVSLGLEALSFRAVSPNVFAVGDVALSLEYVRAPYCLLRVMRVF